MSSPVFFFDPGDQAMIRACTTAQATFKHFWREVCWEGRRIVPALDMSMIKLPFHDTPDSEVEHMWVGNVEFDGDTLAGVLLNEPNELESVSKGDKVSAPFAHLEDWMITCNGKVYGAHTVNCMRSRMSRAERASHDDAWGLDFGDPAQVRLELSGQSQNVSARTGLLSGLFGSKPKRPAPTGHVDHTMCINMLAKVEAQLKENAAPYLAADERGWTMLHHEALAGNLGTVRLLLSYGASPGSLTSNGKTPADLARGIGWPEIAAALTGR